MLSKRKPLAVDTVFTLAMICIFAATSLLVVLFGAKVYKNVVAEMDNNYYSRTPLAYVTNKIRAADAGGNIFLERIEGVDTLVISENRGGTEKYTRIYFYQGWLREAPMDAGDLFEPQWGERIVPAQAFAMEDQGDGFLIFTLETPGGSVVRVTVSLRS